MKKVKYLIVLLCCLVFSCFAVACEKELKGNFFDKSVLKKCEIEFLQKPENATNEVYSNDGYSLYEYTCEMESFSDFENYVKNILQGFIDNYYTFGYFEEVIRLGDMLTSYKRYIKVYPSLDINDYRYIGKSSTEYRFFYTPKPYNKLKERYGGRFLGHRELFLRISNEVNEKGKYELYMEMYGGNSDSEWGNYFFEE